jgi:hypothetical protein
VVAIFFIDRFLETACCRFPEFVQHQEQQQGFGFGFGL